MRCAHYNLQYADKHSLCSEGFSSAPALAKKVVSLFELASDQLSKQPHYDFGMRALKAALVAAGVRKRAQPRADEASLLVYAMRDSNVPKFTQADVELFEGLVLACSLTSPPPPPPPSCVVPELVQCERTCSRRAGQACLMSQLTASALRCRVNGKGDSDPVKAACPA